MKKFYQAAILAGTLAITGCASVPMATKAADDAAKQFDVTDGVSNIYIYRNESFGGAIKMPVLVNDKIAGDTGANTYILKTVEPGKQTIVSKAENDAMIELTTEANQNYFVWQEVKMGAWSARSKLHLVDEAQGQAGVSECKLVK
jgi:hypothetical protein